MKNLPTLLAPAGSVRSFETAVRFGADAVYCGMKGFNLRAKAANFEADALKRMIETAHASGVQVHVTLNIFPLEEDIENLIAQAHLVYELGADAVIVSDLGMVSRIHKELPQLAIHVSTQANTTNSESIRVWAALGARRIVLARELNVAQIAKIAKALGNSVELETFVHGSVCMSWSGRCLLSRYFNGRGANQGACTQPCRWSYTLSETGKPENSAVLEEDERGSYLLSAYDLCMIDHLEELMDAGVTCFKIEGRTKSEYYVGTVTGAYRRELNRIGGMKPETTPDEDRLELLRFSHRPYNTGFYYGRPKETEQDDSAKEEREYIAYVLGREGDRVLVEMKNRFFEGDTAETITPEGSRAFRIRDIYSAETNEKMTSVVKPLDHVWISCPDVQLEAGDMLRGIIRNRADTNHWR